MPKPETHPVERAALATARMLQHLDPGQMAELRRIRTASTGRPAFGDWWHGTLKQSVDNKKRGWQSSVFWPF